MSGVSLYNLAAQYRADFLKLAELDMDDQTVADTLDGMDGELEVKASNVAMFARGLDATIEGMKAARADMDARIKSAENLKGALLFMVKTSMETLGFSKIEAPQIRISIAQNPAALEVYDEALVPAEFWKMPEPKPVVAALDKAAVKAALAAGEEIQGARLVRGSRLVLK